MEVLSTNSIQAVGTKSENSDSLELHQICKMGTSAKFNTIDEFMSSEAMDLSITLPLMISICFCLFFYGVVIAAQCTATFLRSIVLLRILVLGREYAD